MKFIKILAACLLVLAVSACSLTRKDTNAWLDQQNGPVTVDVTGDWDAGGAWSGGWGKATFIQQGKRFNGTLGLYYAEGVVSGDEIFMTIYSGKKVYYTAHLTKKGEDSYLGMVATKAIIDKDSNSHGDYAISLKRKSAR